MTFHIIATSHHSLLAAGKGHMHGALCLTSSIIQSLWLSLENTYIIPMVTLFNILNGT